MLKVALLSAQIGHYEKAYEIYENVATKFAESALLKWSSKEYFFKAGLCRLCIGDMVAAKRNIENYDQIYAGFRDTREQKLLLNILLAFEEEDVDKFTKYIIDFDSISPLDAWMTSILAKVKENLKQDDLR